MKIYKFGKIPTGSVQGMKGMLRLIDNSIPQIIVLSATTETTERLAGIAAHLFNRDTEQAHDEISRLEFRFIDFANELFNDESIKQLADRTIIWGILLSIRRSIPSSIVSGLYGTLPANVLHLSTRKTYWHRENLSAVC